MLQCFERSNAIEIPSLRNRIMFDFYPGLPHMYNILKGSGLQKLTRDCIASHPGHVDREKSSLDIRLDTVWLKK